MNRRDFMRVSAGAALSVTGQAQSRKPNILLVIADDFGWADVGPQGNADIPTPNIDSIARTGVRFTNGYVSCPVCSPTRAGLITGRYQQRFGHEFNPGPAQEASSEFGLPLSETTLAQRMKELGYTTGMVGKWHLGYERQFHPMKRGFDEYFGFLGGAHSYVNARADSRNPILRGTEPVDEKDYLTDAFTREAVAFLNRKRNDPYFLYLAYNAVHGPMEPAPERYSSRFSNIADPRRRTLAGMMTALDEGIGRVLKAAGDDTLVFFLTDNGGPTAVNASRNGPLRGFKGDVFEGGIRVPFFLRWKGRVPSGTINDRPVIAMDLFATAVKAGGGKPTGIDGLDLMGDARHDALYWRFGNQSAIRKGDWKLVRFRDDAPMLFNLAKDVSEANNVADGNRPVVDELTASYASWNAQLAEPKWNSRRRENRRKKR
jgi:arylsulfatase A-like enzyme